MVYVELNDDDKQLFTFGGYSELNTRAIVMRAGALRLLPGGINNDWMRYGRLMDSESRTSWDHGIEPQLGEGNRKIWIIDQA